METKIAIKVNNELEFKALMKHYGSKGFKWSSNELATGKEYYRISHGNGLIEYRNMFSHNLCNNGLDYTIIDFPIFAAIAGIEVVNEVVIDMKSVSAVVNKDGVFFNGRVNCIDGVKLTEIYTVYKSLWE